MTKPMMGISRRWTVLTAIAVLAAVVALAAQSDAEIITKSDPFVSPKGAYVTEPDQYHTFRIPGMVVAPDGSVIVFAEGRRGDGSDPRRDDNAPIDLVMRRSTDNGQTWEKMVVVDSGFKRSGVKVDFADPTPVLDATTDTIHLVYGQWPDHGSLTADVGQDPDSAQNNQVVWVRSSSDSGGAWSDRVQIIYSDQPSQTPDGLYWRQAEPGPGSGIQLQWQDNDPSRNGRLVIPAKRSGSATPTGSSSVRPLVYYSDDHGTTWRVGNVTPGPAANEDEVVELAGGEVLLDARQNSGDFRRRHRSTDGGQSWGANRSDDVAITQVDGSMSRYSALRNAKDRNRILFSGPRGQGGLNRNNITVWTSYDEGRSFINPVEISTGFAAYSVIQRMANGTIGLAYEPATASGASYGGVRFYNFGIEHLEGAQHPATMSHYDGFGNVVDAFQGGVGWSGAWANSGVEVRTGGLEFPGFLTEGDHQHSHLREAEMTRSLGSGVIDLDENRDYYISVFIRRASPDGTDDTEWLDVRLSSGTDPRFAFGVTHAGGDDVLFVRNEDTSSNVLSPAGAIHEDTTYLLLAKLAARNGSDGGSFDRLFLAWYDDPAAVPNDESQVEWQLAGDMSDNFVATLDTISVGAGAGADWLVDGLRMGTSFDAVVVDTGVELPPILGDLNADRQVNLADWVVFRTNMTLDTSGQVEDDRPQLGDFDASGLVDPHDFMTFVDLYDRHNGSGAFLASVPEPGSLLLLFSSTPWLCWKGIRRHPSHAAKTY